MVDESENRRSRWPQTALAVVVAAIFCGAILWAFVTVGTPGTARDRELDQARIRDLRKISWEIQRFYRDEDRLPNNLQELELDPEMLVDPVSKKMYDYIVKDTRKYQLAAEFAVAEEDGGRFHDSDWIHGSGLHYFSLEVKPEPQQTQLRTGRRSLS